MGKDYPYKTDAPIHPGLTPEEVEYKRAIRTLRQQLGLSQAAFARQFGLSEKSGRFTVTRWENTRWIHLPNQPHRRLMRKLFQLNKLRIERGYQTIQEVLRDTPEFAG